MADHPPPTDTPPGSFRLGYGQVFLLLAIVTAIEIWLGSVGLARSIRTGVFLVLSLFKAGMVAAFYMHLRSDSRLYTIVLLAPASLLVVFAILAAVP